VTIEQLLVDGRPVSPVAGLVLPAGRRNLEFHFAAPHFVSPGRVHYRYKLEGLDPDWVEAGPRRDARANTPLSLIMLDLDFFKAYNDTNGHLAGDERLRQVAQALVSAVGRAGDLVARYGGEEFVVLLPGMPQGDAAALAERLRAGVEALGLSHNASTVSRVVTLTAGVATMVPKERTSPAALLAAADGALYRAKGEGRNRVAVAAA
jgi:diguanylate cyclase (GGDEF)-like protein